MAHAIENRNSGIEHEPISEQRALYLLHREIYKIGRVNSFMEGWRVIESRNGKCKTLAYKVGTTVGGTALVVFSGASMTFGVLALMAAVDELKTEDRAPIIGHFSEWTMQGAFSLLIGYQMINEVNVLGEWMLAQKVFHRFLDEQGIHQEAIQAEYLEFLGTRPQTSVVYLPSLPPEELFEDLEEEMAKFSFFRQLGEGWKVVQKEKSCLALSCLNVAVVAGGVFLTVHIINYPFGVFWAGDQAINDLQEGENPNIGGHCLEWSVEWLATINVINYYMRDLANVGRAKMITDLFRKKAQSAMETSLESGSRIFSEMKRQIYSLPRGFFFKIPSWLMYQGDE